MKVNLPTLAAVAAQRYNLRERSVQHLAHPPVQVRSSNDDDIVSEVRNSNADRNNDDTVDIDTGKDDDTVPMPGGLFLADSDDEEDGKAEEIPYQPPSKKPKITYTCHLVHPVSRENEYEGKLADISDGMAVNVMTTTNTKSATYIPIKGYKNYLVDPVYVRELHKQVNGKIVQWRNKVIATAEELIQVGLATEDYIAPQLRFAKYTVFYIIKGLNESHFLPCDILNDDALEKLIPGVVNTECAEFVHKMARCKSFEIIVKKVKDKEDPDNGEILIETRFENMSRRYFGHSTWM